MSEVIPPIRKWPPECCVPAFLYSAMTANGISVPIPEVLPSLLGVRVGPNEANPLGLRLADHLHPPGIRATDAEHQINLLLTELETPLSFRHIPFSKIMFGLWEEVLDIALSKTIIVGLGVDYGVLMDISMRPPSRHVLRVLARKGTYLDLIDDSGEAIPARFSLTWDRVSKAVHHVSDGFWMIGIDTDLNLPFTVPRG